MDHIDVGAGVAGVHAVFEAKVPQSVAGRLEIVNRTFTEIETMGARSQAESKRTHSRC